MVFSEDLADAFKAIQGITGRAIIYSPADGDNVDITATMEQINIRPADDELGRMVIYSTQILILVSEVSTPEIADEIIDGADTWKITSIEGKNTAGTIVNIEMLIDQSKHSADYKKRER